MEKNICPVCREEGKKVKGEVARNFVKPELKDQLSKEEYFLCLTEGCDVAYYHPEEEKVYRNPDDVKIPIWYKAASGEVFACYGNKITEEEVIKAVVENPLYSREKIIEFMNKKEDCGCSKISPDGEDCKEQFDVILEGAVFVKQILQHYKHLKVDETPVDPELFEHHCDCGCDHESDDEECCGGGDDCSCRH
ncbi:MAG: hypothetical protein CSB55_04430 [Candidatus Cloacimonadota bacterium]|nr:MAG: hypothetical protein CSB55_04430 [Candidatus Cloacimonadota bacterium]